MYYFQNVKFSMYLEYDFGRKMDILKHVSFGLRLYLRQMFQSATH
jgi:hypothetical protein